MIDFDENFNYDDVFFRDVTVSITSLLYNKIKWENRFHDGPTRIVSIPFAYSLTGSDRFLLDAFVDDITGNRPDLNIDQIPRGSVVLSAWNRKTNEIANPNVRLQIYREVDGQLQKVSGFYRAVPIKLTYEIEIILSSEIDVWKCSEELLKFFHLYKHFHFEHKFMRHNGVIVFPDSHNTEINRIIQGIDGETNKTIKFSLDIHSHYFIDPTDSEIISTNKKVIFKGNMWELKNKRSKRNWIGR